MKRKIKIAPSILSADFAKLGEEAKRISLSGADFIHVDVMDGNFVPNITIGPDIISAIKPYTSIPLDVHLMISNPLDYIKAFSDAGSDIITFHIEATNSPVELIDLIKSYGKKAGISIKPSTKADAVFPYLKLVDLVLVMTVEPGFGGQVFMNDQLEKIQILSKEISVNNYDIILSVDGGINLDTSKLCVLNGANMLVSGSFLFSSIDLKKAVLDMKNNL